MGKYTDDLPNLNEVRHRRNAMLKHLQLNPDSVYAAEVVAECNRVLLDARLYD